MEKSKQGEECVRAPEEIKSTPKETYAEILSRVIFPEHSTSALSPIMDKASFTIDRFSTSIFLTKEEFFLAFSTAFLTPPA